MSPNKNPRLQSTNRGKLTPTNSSTVKVEGDESVAGNAEVLDGTEAVESWSQIFEMVPEQLEEIDYGIQEGELSSFVNSTLAASIPNDKITSDDFYGKVYREANPEITDDRASISAGLLNYWKSYKIPLSILCDEEQV